MGKDYIERLWTHLEECFKLPGNEWMNRSNHGIYNVKTHDTNPTWNLDHIIPHSLWKYKSMEEPLFCLCWDLSNLRPLDARQNIIEGGSKIRHTNENKKLIKQKVKKFKVFRKSDK